MGLMKYVTGKEPKHPISCISVRIDYIDKCRT